MKIVKGRNSRFFASLRMTRVLLSLAAGALGASLARAQTAPVAPIILELPAGARTLALGNTGVAGRDDDVIFFNPAQIAVATGISASAERFSSTANTGALSAVTRFNGSGGVAIGVRMATFDIPFAVYPANRQTLIDGGALASMSSEASVAFAQTWKSTRFGVAAKYAQDVSASVRLSRPLADVGVARAWFGNTVGLAVQNIGNDRDTVFGQTIEMPVRTTLGLSRAQIAGPLDVYGTAAISMLRTDRLDASGGIEAAYSWLSGYSVALRAGLRRRDIGINPFTAGAGLTIDRMSIDYALETLSNGRIGNRLGVRVR
jgi:hypothetical protein